MVSSAPDHLPSATAGERPSHTPGPWRVWESQSCYTIEGQGNPSGTIAELTGRHSKTTKADANLIAAAPDLLEALKRIKDNIGWRSTRGEDKDQFYCEFCGAHHFHFDLIKHTSECAVTEVCAALLKAEGR